MFQSKEYIQKRHGKTGTDRAYHLNQLVKEYNTTTQQEAKQQVLANLANFAYDPVNYDTLWDLSVSRIFLEATLSEDILLQEFGMGGLANICLDPRFQQDITTNTVHLENIQNCLLSTKSNNLVVNTMTTLMQLITEKNHIAILTDSLRDKLLQLHQSTPFRQAKTMAAVFLLDYYHITVEEETIY